MSRDIFAATQQTPLMKAPSTPSMTPTRSVKRRTYVTNKPKDTTSMAVPKKEALSCFSNSQPVLCGDYYHLRTRQVPLSSSMSELWAQYGIEISNNHISPGGSQEDSRPRRIKDGKENSLFWKCKSFLGLVTVMVSSAFLGALMFSHLQHYLHNTEHCSSHLQIAQDVKEYRPPDQTLQMEDTLVHLTEEVNNLKHHLNKIQNNVGNEVISSPQKGVLEELLTADLASAGNLGSVLATPNTTTVTIPATITLLWFLSFHVRVKHRTPQTTIEGLITEVGDCWPFEGPRGRLVLKLRRRSLVTGVSISHIPPSVSLDGDVKSAPRFFQVLAHMHEDDLEQGRILGGFEYKTSGDWRQSFAFDPSSIAKVSPVEIIEFRFLQNHGHPNYTCVYRVHVHGKTI